MARSSRPGPHAAPRPPARRRGPPKAAASAGGTPRPSGGHETRAPEPFWRTVPLPDMTDAQWESLCDGCGRCCLNKLEDWDTGMIAVTRVACRLLDGETCRCRDYENRMASVPECIQLTPSRIDDLGWLPESCAYRLVADGHDLPDWHPLVSGDPDSVHEAGISVRGWTVSEVEVPVEAWEDHLIAWDSIDPDAGIKS